MNYNRFIISILALLWNEAVLAEVESTQSRKLYKWGSMESKCEIILTMFRSIMLTFDL